MRQRNFLTVILITYLALGIGQPTGFGALSDPNNKNDLSEQSDSLKQQDLSLGGFENRMQKNFNPAPEVNPISDEMNTAVATGGGSSSVRDVLASDDSGTGRDYVLQEGDKVNVKIFPEDQYIKAGEMPVSSDGNIILPLVGKIPVAGKTVLEAQEILAKILDADYLVNPEVVIEVLQFKEQSVVILGQVKRPGSYNFPPGVSKLTLLQAISLAGGFSDVANIKKIKIVRKTANGNKVFRVNAEAVISGDEPDVDIEASDVIHVSESLF